MMDTILPQPETAMKILHKFFPAVFAAILLCLSACSSGEFTAVPVPLHTDVGAIYVVDAGTTWPDALAPAIVGKLAEMGFFTQVASADEVPEGAITLTCAIRMSKRTIPTVNYLRFDVRRSGRILGYAIFDDGGTPAFGTMSDRVDPLLARLFAFVKPRPADSTAK
jgi:hypothetical protein